MSRRDGQGGGGQNPRGPGEKGPKKKIRAMKVCCIGIDICVM